MSSKTSISLAVPSATPPPPPPPPPQSPPSPPSPTLSSPPASPDLPSVPPMSLLVSEESDPSGQLWQFSDNDIQSSSDIDDCDYNYPKSKDLLTQGLNPSSRNDVISSKSSFPLADILASMRKCRVFWRDHTGALNDDIAHIVSPPEQGDDILHFACRYGQLHRLRNLIERTNDLNSRNAVNKTPLHEAIENGQIEAVRLLFELGGTKVDIEALDPLGRSPLFLSATYGFAAIFSELLERGAERNTLWKGLSATEVLNNEDLRMVLCRLHARSSKSKLSKKRFMLLRQRIRRKRLKSPKMCVVCKKDMDGMKFFVPCNFCKRPVCSECIRQCGITACCETSAFSLRHHVDVQPTLDNTKDVRYEDVIHEKVSMSRRILIPQPNGRNLWRVSEQEPYRLSVNPVRLQCRKPDDIAIVDSVLLDLCFVQLCPDNSSALQVNVRDGRYFRIEYESKKKCNECFNKLKKLISERNLYLLREIDYYAGSGYIWSKTPTEPVLFSDLVQISVRTKPTLPFEAPKSLELRLHEKHLAFFGGKISLEHCSLQERDALSFRLNAAGGASYEIYFANESMRIAWQSIVSESLRRQKKVVRKNKTMLAMQMLRGMQRTPFLSRLFPSTA